MQKLLIVIPNLGCGGAEKELVTMLSLLDPAAWAIDLFLFEETGMFLGLVPSTVRIIPRDTLVTTWDLALRDSVRALLRLGRWALAFKRIAFKLELLLAGSEARRTAIIWTYYRQLLPVLPERYDVAVGYLEGMANYYVAEQVSAGRKVGTVHSDYGMLDYLDRGLDRACFEVLDAVRIDSESSRQSLLREFPDLEERFHVAECPVSPTLIRSMAALEADPWGDGFTGIRILTVGRLSHPKGIDLAARACAVLMGQGHPVRWYVVGEGAEREALTALIASLGLERDFILLGVRENPYPYMARADIAVQPSRWEGWSITVEENKILGRPMVLTRAAAGDRIEHQRTGIIVEPDPASIAEGVAALVRDPGLRSRIQKALEASGSAGEENVKKFNRILDPAMAG